MSTLLDPRPFRCASCEAPIQGPPTFFVGLAFCCAGCVAGGPCTCSYDAEPASVREVPGRSGPTGPADDADAVADEPAVDDEPRTDPVEEVARRELVSLG
jgi:hypothetical protein